MFEITKTWLAANSRNGKSGWNAKQLALIEILWPPPKGWMQMCLGQKISGETKLQFEALSGKSIEGVKIDRGKANMATNPVYHSWPDGNGGWYGEWMSDARPPWDTSKSSQGRQHSPKVKTEG